MLGFGTRTSAPQLMETAITIGRPLLWLYTLVCVFLLGLQVYSDIQLSSTAVVQQPVVTPTSTPPETTVSLSSANLFGSIDDNTKAEPVIEKIPETRLQLVLKGAFSSSTRNQASALIAEKGKPAERFYVNDTLPGGAILTSVDANYVTLSRGDQLELLRFPKSTSDTTADNSTYGLTNRTSSSAASSDSRTADERAESIRERLLRLRENKSQ